MDLQELPVDNLGEENESEVESKPKLYLAQEVSEPVFSPLEIKEEEVDRKQTIKMEEDDSDDDVQYIRTQKYRSSSATSYRSEGSNSNKRKNWTQYDDDGDEEGQRKRRQRYEDKKRWTIERTKKLLAKVERVRADLAKEEFIREQREYLALEEQLKKEKAALKLQKQQRSTLNPRRVVSFDLGITTKVDHTHPNQQEIPFSPMSVQSPLLDDNQSPQHMQYSSSTMRTPRLSETQVAMPKPLMRNVKIPATRI